MDDVTRKTAIHRLRSIAGHVKSIERMVEEGQYCIDIIGQVQAVQAALSKVNNLVLDNHLHSCITDVIKGEDPVERERVLAEILDVYRIADKT
jgi:DNA-binding FrmR family transcriptional regulator